MPDPCWSWNKVNNLSEGFYSVQSASNPTSENNSYVVTTGFVLTILILLVKFLIGCLVFTGNDFPGR